jgi:hypothetical protein
VPRNWPGAISWDLLVIPVSIYNILGMLKMAKQLELAMQLIKFIESLQWSSFNGFLTF